MSHYNGQEILKSNWITKEHAAFHFEIDIQRICSWIASGELQEWRRRSGPPLVVSVKELEQLLKDKS